MARDTGAEAEARMLDEGHASPRIAAAPASAPAAAFRWSCRMPQLAAVSRVEQVALVAILAVAAALRLVWVRLMPVPPESDFATFHWMTQQIAAGHWQPGSYGWRYGGPGYPLLLAPLLTAGGGLMAIRVANVLLQLGMVLGIWLLGRRLFSPQSALAGASIAAVFPGLWAYTPLVAAEHLAVLLITAIAGLLCQPRRGWQVALIGAAAVALAFTRPAYLPFTVLAVLAAVVANGRPSLSRLRWWGLGAALVFAPVALANQLGGGPVLSGSAATNQLWIVNNERATGAWFPAADADDYPFKGLADDAGGEIQVGKAQRKLGLQFMAANPWQTLRGFALRHQLNWANDRMGAFWTLDRAPSYWRDRVPWVDRLPDLFDRFYVAVLALAAVGAVRYGRRPALLFPLVLPLAYVLAVYTLAEGNGRYHVTALPLLCVLAGAALVPSKHLVWVLPTSALAWWLGPRIDAATWLILIVVLAPLAQLAARALPSLLARFAWVTHRHPWRVFPAAALLLAVLVLAAASLKSSVDRTLAELAAVDPRGWQSYPARSGKAAQQLPLLLQDSGTRAGLREVSYPDAVLLQFAHDPRPGEVVGLVRTLPGLTPGRSYLFYLQLYDPRSMGDPGESLTVALNERVIWQRERGEAETAGWRYLSLPWVADASMVTIRIERRAGTDPGGSRGTPPAVRTLHLYPKY